MLKIKHSKRFITQEFLKQGSMIKFDELLPHINQVLKWEKATSLHDIRFQKNTSEKVLNNLFHINNQLLESYLLLSLQILNMQTDVQQNQINSVMYWTQKLEKIQSKNLLSTLVYFINKFCPNMTEIHMTTIELLCKKTIQTLSKPKNYNFLVALSRCWNKYKKSHPDMRLQKFPHCYELTLEFINGFLSDKDFIAHNPNKAIAILKCTYQFQIPVTSLATDASTVISIIDSNVTKGEGGTLLYLLMEYYQNAGLNENKLTNIMKIIKSRLPSLTYIQIRELTAILTKNYKNLPIENSLLLDIFTQEKKYIDEPHNKNQASKLLHLYNLCSFLLKRNLISPLEEKTLLLEFFKNADPINFQNFYFIKLKKMGTIEKGAFEAKIQAIVVGALQTKEKITNALSFIFNLKFSLEFSNKINKFVSDICKQKSNSNKNNSPEDSIKFALLALIFHNEKQKQPKHEIINLIFKLLTHQELKNFNFLTFLSDICWENPSLLNATTENEILYHNFLVDNMGKMANFEKTKAFQLYFLLKKKKVNPEMLNTIVKEIDMMKDDIKKDCVFPLLGIKILPKELQNHLVYLALACDDANIFDIKWLTESFAQLPESIQTYFSNTIKSNVGRLYEVRDFNAAIQILQIIKNNSSLKNNLHIIEIEENLKKIINDYYFSLSNDTLELLA